MREQMSQELFQKRAEESIQKRFHKRLFTPFAKACKTYRLISGCIY